MLNRYLSDSAHDPIPDETKGLDHCRTWANNLDGLGADAQESELEGAFVNLLTSALGYRLFPDRNCTLWPKPPSRATHLPGTPDLVLGDFKDPAEPRFIAAVELKSPGTDLDKPQHSRPDKKSPVEQGFLYGQRLLGARWVIISDLRTIRLYSIDDQFAYEQFDISQISTREHYQRLWRLMSAPAMIPTNGENALDTVYTKSAANRVALSEGFYTAYTQIRGDLYAAIEEAAKSLPFAVTADELLLATQRLLDRLIFLMYCEDHPLRLVNPGTLERIVEAATSLPGTASDRVYTVIKQLFREVDEGSPPASGLKVSGYNGELFKLHPIIDAISLPDDLAKKVYRAPINSGSTRTIKGVWGLHVFDFWSELDEHMLGKVFEESLSDFSTVAVSGDANTAHRLRVRKLGGIYYTNDRLASFAIDAPLMDLLALTVPTPAIDADNPARYLESQLEALASLRIADLSCGSGAFIVAAYRILLTEYWRLRESTRDPDDATDSLFTHEVAETQASLLRNCIYGIDLLPQAVELAKLALWLRSARRDEKVPSLATNFATADSLDLPNALAQLDLRIGELDLIIGNPPWGAAMPATSYRAACSSLSLDPAHNWDSWELFLLLGLHALKPGGRLALILPDSLLYEDRHFVRQTLITSTQIKRLHVLGPGWFGDRVRMGTLLLDVEKTLPEPDSRFKSIILGGSERKAAIRGSLPLTQLESRRMREIPQMRSVPDAYQIEPGRSAEDDRIIDVIMENSTTLDDTCTHGRGEEMNKAGNYWPCPSCNYPNLPGANIKGSYEAKICLRCNAKVAFDPKDALQLVRDATSVPPRIGEVPYFDGDDLGPRYPILTPVKVIRTDLPLWSYKPASHYTGPKLLIRQAGVGITSAFDVSDAYCPQSIYMFRLQHELEQAGWTLQYIHGALASRTMAYFVFKRFSEVDPDKAHAKLTLARLGTLPIPKLDLTSQGHRAALDTITTNVDLLNSGQARNGGPEDWDIEVALRDLWGLTGDHGAYINSELQGLPQSQATSSLFPT